jgi:5-methylcytosine-specific restriction endonuclease McrA
MSELIGKKRPCINSTRRRKINKNLLARDGNLCHYCYLEMTPNGGERLDSTMTREHVVPLCYGGGSMQDNMVLCCNSCNNLRGNDLHYCGCQFCISAYDKYYVQE